MRVAIPVLGDGFCDHFGGADRFALVDIDDQTRTITSTQMEVPPPHEQGAFPVWLRSQGVSTVLAGGMGPRAVQMLDHFGIEVVLGIEGHDIAELVTAYLNGELRSTGSSCAAPGMHGCHDH